MLDDKLSEVTSEKRIIHPPGIPKQGIKLIHLSLLPTPTSIYVPMVHVVTANSVS